MIIFSPPPIIFVPVMGKTLLIYASFGEGHKQAAMALRGFLDAPCHDLLSFCPRVIRNIYSAGYSAITNKSPLLWKFLFYFTRFKRGHFVITSIHKIIFSSLYRYLEETKLKTVITTHFFPLQLSAAWKKKLGLKIITIVTDLRVHPLWINTETDHYFAAAQETKDDLIRMGIKEDKIIDGFLPLREGFLETRGSQDLRNKFSLDQKPCLLFVCSLRGFFPFLKELIFSLKDSFNIFIIYGKNKKLKGYLESLNFNSLRIFPSYENIWELFQISSVIITKPGGLTVFEGLYKKKPFIFTHYIPGQEKENMDLLIKYKIARYVGNKQEFIDALKYFQEREREWENNYPIQIKDIREVLAKIT